MKIATILGARPQFIKHSMVSKSLRQNNIDEIIIHTGQHFDTNMSDIFFDSLKLPKPAFNLDSHHANPSVMLSNMISKLWAIIQDVDFVLVYGDTISTLAGAICATNERKKLIHIESGLRSFDPSMSEERNRILTDRLSHLLFVPCKNAIENLRNEGFLSSRGGFGEVVLVGDVMYDSFLHYRSYAIKPASVGDLGDFVLLTIHRQENVDFRDRLSSILRGVGEIEKEVIFPIHPRTKKNVIGLEIPKNIKIIEPVGYLETLWLLDRCSCVITDSGGLQKEAYFANKKSLVLRERSEWVELVEFGMCELLGSREISECYNLLMDKEIPFVEGIYGNGNSSEKIAKHILEFKL